MLQMCDADNSRGWKVVNILQNHLYAYAMVHLQCAIERRTIETARIYTCWKWHYRDAKQVSRNFYRLERFIILFAKRLAGGSDQLMLSEQEALSEL